MSLNTILATAPLATTGFHIKATGTTLGNSLIWDNGTNVGIGNTNTSYTLDVSGTGRYNGSATTMLSVISSATASGLELKNTGGTASDWIIQSDGGAVAGQAALRFYSITASAYRMSIDGSGNVGIGTSSPTALMQIQGAQQGVSGKNLTISYNSTYYAEYTEKSISAFNNPLTFGAGTTGAEMMRISASGNVGIGNSNPQKKLDISGDAFAGIGIYDGTNTAVMQWHSSDGFRIVTATAKPIVFFTNDTERMRIINNGNICMATSTDFGYKLNLNGQPGCNGYTAWTNWSDSRLKENVTDLETSDVLKKICAIRPVTYNYNELSGFDEATRSRRISGFIAQELMEVFPDMVGTIKKDDVEYYDTNLSNLDLYLVKAIQEMNTKLDEQNQTIQNLQEQINILAK